MCLRVCAKMMLVNKQLQLASGREDFFDWVERNRKKSQDISRSSFEELLEPRGRHFFSLVSAPRRTEAFPATTETTRPRTPVSTSTSLRSCTTTRIKQFHNSLPADFIRKKQSVIFLPSLHLTSCHHVYAI